jgi:hypothetical protein
MRRTVLEALFDALRPIDAGSDEQHGFASADARGLRDPEAKAKSGRSRLSVSHSTEGGVAPANGRRDARPHGESILPR